MGKQHINPIASQLLPSSVVILFAILGAIVLLALGSAFIQSLYHSSIIEASAQYFDKPPGLFTAYIQILIDTSFYLSFGITILITTLITLISTAIGIAIALFMRSYASKVYLLRLAYQIPIAIPHVIVALFFLLFFAQSGFLSRLLYHVNILNTPQQFPALVNDRLFLGIVFSYCTKEIPFIVLVSLSALQSVDNNLEHVAAALGATATIRIRKVVIPLLLPTLSPIIAVIFSFVFGSFEIPSLLGRSHPPLLPVLLYRYYRNPNILYRPNALALSMIITAFTLLVSFIFLRVCNKHKIVHIAH